MLHPSAVIGESPFLDAVMEDARDLRRDISGLDQQKPDEYLTSVREVEQGIGNAGRLGEMGLNLAAFCDATSALEKV